MKRAVLKYKPLEGDKELNLSQCQSYLVSLLSEVVVFFNDNNIDYFLLWGTLLGAKRNGKMIPWDDDIDIGVTKENYEKLLNNLDKLSNYRIKYLHYSKNSKMYTNEIRVYLDGYYRIQQSNFRSYLTPLCIDIFVAEKIDCNMDSNTKKNFERKFKKTIDLLIQKEAIWKSTNTLKAIMRSIIKCALFLIPTKCLHRRLEKLSSKLYQDDNDYYFCFPETLHNPKSYLKTYDKSMFETTFESSFENIKVRIPSLSNQLLEINYGEWQIPKDRTNGDVFKEKFILRK